MVDQLIPTGLVFKLLRVEETFLQRVALSRMWSPGSSTEIILCGGSRIYKDQKSGLSNAFRLSGPCFSGLPYAFHCSWPTTETFRYLQGSELLSNFWGECLGHYIWGRKESVFKGRSWNCVAWLNGGNEPGAVGSFSRYYLNAAKGHALYKQYFFSLDCRSEVGIIVLSHRWGNRLRLSGWLGSRIPKPCSSGGSCVYALGLVLGWNWDFAPASHSLEPF